MSVATETKLIAPHGGELVDRTSERPDDLDSLETLTLMSRELSDLDMLASGALSPLTGFMGREDYESVLETMRLAGGLPWALPVCLSVAEAPRGERIALADEAGKARAVLEIEEVFEYDKEREAQQSFRTSDDAHPGVARLYEQQPLYLSGSVTVFERAEAPFPQLALDPGETRAAFAERGWKRVVGFQTRNPIHRAHEYLTKVALETVDGLLIHPLVGDTKSEDVPARRGRPRVSLRHQGEGDAEQRRASSAGVLPARGRGSSDRGLSSLTWQFTLTGLLIGVLVGLTGMGGGSLMTPILVIVFGFKPTYAVGTDILHGAIFKTFGRSEERRVGKECRSRW